MDKNKTLKIVIGLGIGLGASGLIFCLIQRQQVSEKAPQASLSPRGVAPSFIHNEDVKSQSTAGGSSTDPQKGTSSVSVPSSSVSESDCEVSQSEDKPEREEKDEFMDGMLADADDDSGNAWGDSQADDPKEAAAFERQAKAFRSIAGELTGQGSEKQKIQVTKKSKKNCIAKK